MASPQIGLPASAPAARFPVTNHDPAASAPGPDRDRKPARTTLALLLNQLPRLCQPRNRAAAVGRALPGAASPRAAWFRLRHQFPKYLYESAYQVGQASGLSL